MKLESLTALYLEQLRDLYSAETQLIEVLPKLAAAAAAADLRKAFNHHLRQTEEHVRRLEQMLQDLQESPGGHVCEAMKGLVKEAEQMLGTRGEPNVVDAGLIAAAQRAEHYEIAGYGTLRTYAELLDKSEHVSLLERTLQEEEETDERLTELAETHVNEEALVR